LAYFGFVKGGQLLEIVRLHLKGKFSLAEARAYLTRRLGKETDIDGWTKELTARFGAEVGDKFREVMTVDVDMRGVGEALVFDGRLVWRL
jgi:hypothetical protein